MLLYGLIGYPLGHSHSSAIFREIFMQENITLADYQLFPLEDIRGIRALVRSHDLEGFSVTIPHKTAIIPYLDTMDKDAAKIGAVNAVKVVRDQGRLFLQGYNTDAPAFLETLRALELQPETRALVLGSGGASRAVRNALEAAGIPYLVVTRSPQKAGFIAYSDLSGELLHGHKLVINATPRGMFPDTDTFPLLPYEHFTADHIAYDLVYNPPETEFLKKARQQGAFIINGLHMLQIQAELAWRIWTGAESEKKR